MSPWTVLGWIAVVVATVALAAAIPLGIWLLRQQRKRQERIDQIGRDLKRSMRTGRGRE